VHRPWLRELPVPLIAAAVALAYAWQTWGFPVDAIAFPYGVGLLMLGFAGFVLARPGEAAEEQEPPEPGAGRRSLGLVVATLGYVWAMGWIGFFLATAAFLGGTMWLLGNRRPLLYLPVAVACAAGVTLVLDRLLAITVPAFPYATLPFGF
jgi:hypothetical protein